MEEKTLVIKIVIDSTKTKNVFKEAIMNNFMPTNLKIYEMSKFFETMLLKSLKKERQ